MPGTAPKLAEARPSHKTPQEIVESADFKALVRRRWTVSSIPLVLLFVTYYGFVLLIATDKALMSQRIGEYTTLAIPVGIAVIVAAFALTAIYVAWANRTYDPEVDRLKKQLRP